MSDEVLNIGLLLASGALSAIGVGYFIFGGCALHEVAGIFAWAGTSYLMAKN